MVTSQWVVGTTGNEFPSCECVLFFCKGTGGYFAAVLKSCLTYLSYTMNRTPGVPQAMIDTEVWVPFDRDEPVKSPMMVDAGSLGITGRSV